MDAKVVRIRLGVVCCGLERKYNLTRGEVLEPRVGCVDSYAFYKFYKNIKTFFNLSNRKFVKIIIIKCP